MVRISKGNILESRANVIMCNYGNDKFAQLIEENFPHTAKEAEKFIRYCNKNKMELLGNVQYVPSEIWAIGLVDTIKNNNVIAYDKEYQYIANMFCQSSSGDKVHMDLKALKKALYDVKDKAEKLNATVAIPYGFGAGKNKELWESIFTMIKSVFGKSDVEVIIWQ